MGCTLAPDVRDELGIVVGQQIRLRRSTQSLAVFTVLDDHASTDGPIGLWPAGLRRVDTETPFTGSIRGVVPHGDHTADEAERHGELVEGLLGAERAPVIAIAPHGGWIERYTARQVEALVGTDHAVAGWYCRGYRSDGGAYDRWHVPSTDIHPRSFPDLATAAGRGHRLAISFHGYGGDGIRIGGGANGRLKQRLRSAIAAQVPELRVELATREAYAGDHPDNIVNRLSSGGAGGVQIEQSWTAREHHWRSIVAGVNSALPDR
jgi:phage replication-related protein YjqB (UPF0714/DUF867 family)